METKAVGEINCTSVLPGLSAFLWTSIPLMVPNNRYVIHRHVSKARYVFVVSNTHMLFQCQQRVLHFGSRANLDIVLNDKRLNGWASARLASTTGILWCYDGM